MKFRNILAGIFFSSLAIGVAYADAGENATSSDAIKDRIKPAGEVSVADKTATATPAVTAADSTAKPTGANAQLAEGQKVVDQYCQVCHKAGIAGAPKMGDAAAWEPRIKQGVNTLDDHAIKGYTGQAGMMPPKGTCMTCTDEQIKAAVAYMVSLVKSSDGAAAPAADKSAAAPATPAAAAGH